MHGRPKRVALPLSRFRAPRPAPPPQFIVALRAGADPDAARAAIVDAGGTPSAHLPEAAVLAILPAGGAAAAQAARAALAAHPAVGWVAPFAPPYRIAPEWGPVLDWAAGLPGGYGEEEAGGGVSDGSEAAGRAAGGEAAAAGAAPGKAAAPYLRPPAPPGGNNSTASTATTASAATIPPPAWTVEILVTFPPLGPFPGGAGGGEGAGAPNPPPLYAPATAAAAAWAPALAAICGPASCTTTPADSPLAPRLSITAPAALAPALVPWLAASPAAHWVSPRARARARNFFAAGICQSGGAGRVDVATGTVWAPAGAAGSPTAASTTPHWEAGLRGGGQTLGMGDTGLDADHCLFADPDVPGPGAPGSAPGRVGADGVRAWESVVHRKLR